MQSVTAGDVAGLCGDIFADVGEDICPNDTELLKQRYYEFFYKTLTPVQLWERVFVALRDAGYEIARMEHQ